MKMKLMKMMIKIKSKFKYDLRKKLNIIFPIELIDMAELVK